VNQVPRCAINAVPLDRIEFVCAMLRIPMPIELAMPISYASAVLSPEQRWRKEAL
jgi:hypothetical protein